MTNSFILLLIHINIEKLYNQPSLKSENELVNLKHSDFFIILIYLTSQTKNMNLHRDLEQEFFQC